MLNVDGWTDGRTNGRKLARLCLPAKAGATKIVSALFREQLLWLCLCCKEFYFEYVENRCFRSVLVKQVDFLKFFLAICLQKFYYLQEQ